jgi:hypothetical protein
MQQRRAVDSERNDRVTNVSQLVLLVAIKDEYKSIRDGSSTAAACMPGPAPAGA